jgi:hypothetical protein
MTKLDLKGAAPESWACIDCGFDTAPGAVTRAQLEQQVVAVRADQSMKLSISPDNEMYHVRRKVWAAAKLPPDGGCLCVGCLEKRIGRRLKPEDFPNHPLNWLPGSDRLLSRRDGGRWEFVE